MSVAIQTFTAIKLEDLTTPTSDQRYPLGLIVPVADMEATAKTIKRYMYVKSHTTLTQYQPYVIKASATAGSEVITGAPFTINDSTGIQVCVPQVAFTSGYYGFVQIEGEATALKSAETYAVGDFLEVLNTGTSFVVDGTSGATVESKVSAGISKVAGTTAQAILIQLIGRISNVSAT